MADLTRTLRQSLHAVPLAAAVMAICCAFAGSAKADGGSSGQNQAYDGRQSGNLKPLITVAREVAPYGKILDARLVGSKYRLKVIDSRGHVSTLIVDARFGRGGHKANGGSESDGNSGSGSDGGNSGSGSSGSGNSGSGNSGSGNSGSGSSGSGNSGSGKGS